MAKTSSKKGKGEVPLLAAYFLKRFAGQLDPLAKVTDQAMRSRYAFLESWVSIIGNVLLAIIKVFFGIALNSISLMADAIHTASDVATSAVVILGFRISRLPPDEKHPFGHGRAESLTALAIAVMLTVVGFEFGKSSYKRLLSNALVMGNVTVAFVMLLSAVVKEWMTRFALYLGDKANAPALAGDALHHRTDAIASLLVAIAIIASMYGYYRVDAILGLAVSGLIIYTGVQLAVNSASELIGEKPGIEMENKIKAAALGCPGVTDAHDIVVHDYGIRKSMSLHITVKQGLSLQASHDIASAVEEAIREQVQGDVVVHVEPEEPDEITLY